MSELATAVFAAEAGMHLIDEPRSHRFAEFVRLFDERAYVDRLAARGIAWIGRSDSTFPALLASIHDPPAGLFVRAGAPLDLAERAVVAVVGARACSSYGSGVAFDLSRSLAAAGAVVVSGLARGVDGAAHRGALDAGRTIAVLGCGIDRDYPRAHAGLAERIAADGWIISEYPPGVEPAPWRFPARNRIVAGLARATVVVEARERSGALITADLALEEGRDVLAVPGEITSALSRGTNALIRLGAIPVTCVEDVLELLGLGRPSGPDEPTGPPLDAVCASVLEVVSAGACAVDEIVRRAALGASTVAAALAELELQGYVRESEGLYRCGTPSAVGSRGHR